MYYGRKKGIIIAIVVVVILIIALVVGGVLLYMNTDLFKSEKTLFWKYMGSGFGNIKFTQNTQLKDIEKMKEQSPYTVSGKATFSSTDEDANSELEKVKVSIDEQTDKIDDYSHINTKLNYSNSDIFNLDYVKDGDIYALKSDEIVTVYLGVRNENLKVIMQKLGLDDKLVPNQITPINSANLFDFTDEELNYIKETYASIIQANILDSAYSKQTGAVIEKDGVSYNTTSYRVDLAGNQISNILVNILGTLKTDSITLNLISTKAKELGLGDEYTTIDGLNNMIDNMIANIQESQFEDLSFVVYAYKGETIATEILVKNTSKITVYNNGSLIKIVYEDLTADAKYGTINIEILNQVNSTQSIYNIKVTLEDGTEYTLYITNDGSVAQGGLNTTCSFTISKDETIEIDYEQTLEFTTELEDIVNLDETNCAILNDYPQDALNTLIQAVINQTIVVINQKAEILGLIEPTTNEIPVQ